MSKKVLDNTTAKRSRSYRVAVAVFLAACLAALLCVTGCFSGSGSSSKSTPVISSITASDKPAVSTSAQSSSAAPVTIPIDFDALQEENGDVYAWIYIPDTEVNHPVVQNSIIDNFYLVHDAYGNYNELGALYTQSMNSLDFTDPVTLIYGHTLEEGGVVSDVMFGTLHYFSDETFFNEHPTFYIYLPDRILTYEIVSAYEYDNRHIMNSYDFDDPEVAQAYFDYVLDPDSMFKNVREHARLTAGKDRIVQLSTCTHPPVDSARYLITGVLVDEQLAK